MIGGLPYYGGKHPTTARCAWINGCIGPTPDRSYIEPFAGMLGVLLSRQPVPVEIANDANGYVVAWWRAVRDHPAEFGRLIATTPNARAVYDEAVERIREPCSGDILADALLLHIAVSQNINRGPVPTRGSWRIVYAAGMGSLGHEQWGPAKAEALAARLRNVQLECRDACEILDRSRKVENAMIYCDPPYRSADHSPYGEVSRQLDWDALQDLLAAQLGRVAISGYDDEWDALGWHRHEKPTIHRPVGMHNNSGSQASARVEVLWCNFSPDETPTLL